MNIITLYPIQLYILLNSYLLHLHSTTHTPHPNTSQNVKVLESWDEVEALGGAAAELIEPDPNEIVGKLVCLVCLVL